MNTTPETIIAQNATKFHKNKVLDEILFNLLSRERWDFFEVAILIECPKKTGDTARDLVIKQQHIDQIISQITPILNQHWGILLWKSYPLGSISVKVDCLWLDAITKEKWINIKSIWENPLKKRTK